MGSFYSVASLQMVGSHKRIVVAQWTRVFESCKYIDILEVTQQAYTVNFVPTECFSCLLHRWQNDGIEGVTVSHGVLIPKSVHAWPDSAYRYYIRPFTVVPRLFLLERTRLSWQPRTGRVCLRGHSVEWIQWIRKNNHWIMDANSKTVIGIKPKMVETDSKLVAIKRRKRCDAITDDSQWSFVSIVVFELYISTHRGVSIIHWFDLECSLVRVSVDLESRQDITLVESFRFIESVFSDLTRWNQSVSHLWPRPVYPASRVHG